MSIIVYTAIFGGYDVIRPPVTNNKDVKYTLFTYKGSDIIDGWYSPDAANTVFEPIRNTGTIRGMTTRKLSRWYKTHPHIAFPDHTISIWHGGNIEMLIDPLVAIDKWLGNVDMVAFKHPHRSCAYKEANACREMGKGNSHKITAQMVMYRRNNFPLNYGLSACWFLIRRNNDVMKEFNEMWWHEINRGSARDQLSFDFCRWEMAGALRFDNVPGDLLTSPHFRYHNHKGG